VVRKNVQRICVAGFHTSHNVGRAKYVADAIAASKPDEYETWYYFSNMGFKAALTEFLAELPDEEKEKESTTDKGTKIGQHHSAPFVWIEEAGVVDEGGKIEGKKYTAIGGCDKVKKEDTVWFGVT